MEVLPPKTQTGFVVKAEKKKVCKAKSPSGVGRVPAEYITYFLIPNFSIS
jgi:hypothetical protein